MGGKVGFSTLLISLAVTKIRHLERKGSDKRGQIPMSAAENNSLLRHLSDKTEMLSIVWEKSERGQREPTLFGTGKCPSGKMPYFLVCWFGFRNDRKELCI